MVSALLDYIYMRTFLSEPFMGFWSVWEKVQMGPPELSLNQGVPKPDHRPIYNVVLISPFTTNTVICLYSPQTWARQEALRQIAEEEAEAE